MSAVIENKTVEPIVSVNITTYNRSALLSRALKSVLSQNYEQYEIVVVDDCSPDDTEDVVREYQKHYPGIRYIRKETNKGLSAARNTGWKNSSGKYIALMDDDDEWCDENKLAKQVKILEENEDVSLVCSSVRIYSSASEYRDKYIYEPPNLGKLILNGNGWIYTSSVMLRRSALERVEGYDEKRYRGVDSDLFRRGIIHHGFRVYFMPEITEIAHEYGDDRITSRRDIGKQMHMVSNQIRMLFTFPRAFMRYPGAALKRIGKIIYGVCSIPFLWFVELGKRFHISNTDVSFIEVIKKAIFPMRWRFVLWIRSLREYAQRFRSWPVDRGRKRPYIIFMTGMPRTGTSLMKNYLGDYPGFKIRRFQPRGFYKSWRAAVEENKDIYIDKSTHYIRHLGKIQKTCGLHARFCIIVRDPRDQLASLFEFKRHPELPRHRSFWRKWERQYGNVVRFAQSHPRQQLFLLRYEDLVQYPVEAKTAFLNWCGKDTSAAPVDNTYRVAHANDNQDEKVSAQASASTGSVGSHTTITDPKRKRTIETYRNIPAVRRLMKTFGYIDDDTVEEISLPKNIEVFKLL